MSLDFAILNHLPIKRYHTSFLLADGSIGYSIGLVRLDGTTSTLSPTGWSSEFLVLPTCAVPLVLGRQYLFDAGLLSVLQETSHVTAIHNEAPTPLENLTSCIKVRLRNVEGSTEVLALPDKGSIRNAVSLALAQSLDSATTTFIDHQEDIILGNAASFKTCGVLDASIKFNGKSRRLGWIRMRFAVVESLLFRLILGNSAIERFRVLGENQASFDWLHLRDEHNQFCMWRGSKKKGSPLQKYLTPLQPDAPGPAIAVDPNPIVQPNPAADDERLQYINAQILDAGGRITKCEEIHRTSLSPKNTEALLKAQGDKILRKVDK